MTDLEISKALALAIGWKNVLVLGGYVLVHTGNPGDKVFFRKHSNTVHNHRIFDYRDWSVIGPIAERYDCFPTSENLRLESGFGLWADTPQKAIALAVIAGAKK